MKSFFDPCYREKDCVPVAYSWYDRADMMKTTLEAVNHSHSLCEIMYVCEGGMSIETEAGRWSWEGGSWCGWTRAFVTGT